MNMNRIVPASISGILGKVVDTMKGTPTGKTLVEVGNSEEKPTNNPELGKLQAMGLANRGYTHLLIAAHVLDATEPLEAEINRLTAALAEKDHQLAEATSESKSAQNAKLNLQIAATKRDAIDGLMSGLSDAAQADTLKILRELGSNQKSLGVKVKVSTEEGDLREGSVTLRGKSLTEAFPANGQAARVQDAVDKYLLLSGNWSWSGMPDINKGALPKLVTKEGVAHIDGRPYPSNTQQREATFEKLDKRQQFSEGKGGPVTAALLLSAAAGLGVNALHEMNPPPPVVIHDTTPTIAAPLLAGKDSSVTELQVYRDKHFEKVAVQAGEGYSQLLARLRPDELNKLGAVLNPDGSISPRDTKLGVVIQQMKLMTILDQEGKFDLKHLTDPHFIEGPAGKFAYIPKTGELENWLRAKGTN